MNAICNRIDVAQVERVAVRATEASRTQRATERVIRKRTEPESLKPGIDVIRVAPVPDTAIVRLDDDAEQRRIAQRRRTSVENEFLKAFYVDFDQRRHRTGEQRVQRLDRNGDRRRGLVCGA